MAAQTYDPDYPVCLHVYGPVTYYECRYTSLAQCNAVGIGPRGSVRASIRTPRTRKSRWGAPTGGTATIDAQSSSTTWPSTSDTRRSMRPASSMLWVAISIATRVALTSCISAPNT